MRHQALYAVPLAHAGHRVGAGGIDPSELPSSYKKAATVARQIESFGLAEIEDYIDTYGCVMAGEMAPVWARGRKPRR